MDSQSTSETFDNSTIEVSDQPLLNSPIGYSMNQNRDSAKPRELYVRSSIRSRRFSPKKDSVIEKTQASIINRHPDTCSKKFRCFSLDSNDFLYMDERLVIPKPLRPLILRTLHYGQPGRDSMLATVANAWWPRLHRGKHSSDVPTTQDSR